MNRPLVITDCDEVLLHMVTPFRGWLDEAHGVEFRLGPGHDWSRSMTRRESGLQLEMPEMWNLLGEFFDTQMHRQSPFPGAVEAMAKLGEHADVVVLTNLQDHRQDARARQLADHGINLRVYTNQGPKGPAIKAILDEFSPSRAVFIDDIAQHHGSAAELVPHVSRLHLCAEPLLAPHIQCAHVAGHAHARIDDWKTALPWLLDRIEGKTDD